MNSPSPILNDFEKIIQRLKEVLSLEKTDVNRDSAIKRFELCFDLAWKSIKEYAKKQGVECNSPRACFKIAFQLQLVNYDEHWLEMIEDRNLSTHLYKEEYADQIYSKLPDYLGMFRELLDKLVKSYQG